MNGLIGKVVVVTQLRSIPKNCSSCKYYDSMGGRPGRGNDGACTAKGTYYSTQTIQPSKEWLETCPLRLVE